MKFHSFHCVWQVCYNIETRVALLGEDKESESVANGTDDDTPTWASYQTFLHLRTTPKKELRPRREQAYAGSTEAQAKQREAARAKAASVKQAIAKHRRLDEKVNNLERRLDGIDREFRQLLGSVSVKPLRKDRFYNRIGWFDGMGAASLLGCGDIVQYGTSQLFVQGPSTFD
jgi:bromodomain adjacent to zinc finger domain protein 1A